MATISKPYTYSPNTTISSSEMNANLDRVYNEFNGSISADNLASNAVTGDKIATSNVTTAKIADSNVTSAVLGSDSVTSPKIDWTSTGAGAGIWWEELGRSTLTSAASSMTVSSLTSRKYLQVIVFWYGSGGTANAKIQFNSDTAANYAIRYSQNGAADSTAVSTANAYIDMAGALTTPQYCSGNIINVAGQEKMFWLTGLAQSTAGAGTAPIRRYATGKWANATDAISSITVANAGGTGSFGVGSYLIVLGHN